jgi:hypothetical protein
MSRRAAMIGAMAGAGVALTGAAVWEGRRLLRHRASGEYADLVNRLDDPAQAALLGNAILAQSPFALSATEEEAPDLRAQLAKTALPDALMGDVSSGLVVEAGGWIIPATLAALCVLATRG